MLLDRLDCTEFIEKTTLLKGSYFARKVENSSIALIEDAEEGRNVSESNRFNKKNRPT